MNVRIKLDGRKRLTDDAREKIAAAAGMVSDKRGYRVNTFSEDTELVIDFGQQDHKAFIYLSPLQGLYRGCCVAYFHNGVFRRPISGAECTII